ncbi:hypothetical protein D3C75_1241450 [compost metagenome]
MSLFAVQKKAAPSAVLLAWLMLAMTGPWSVTTMRPLPASRYATKFAMQASVMYAVAPEADDMNNTQAY